MKPKDEVQQEIDAIFGLLAYALVYKDWQDEGTDRYSRRGYNVGALLVNPKYQAVMFELNSIDRCSDVTQHGELRVMTKYLQQTKNYNLEGFTIYATLEPCVMCAGMMTMTSVQRVVFGQQDVMFSKAFERLAMDTRNVGGYAPYPRQVKVEASPLKYGAQLDAAYQQYLATAEEKILALFLASHTAKEIFKTAYEEFLSFKPELDQNTQVYAQARHFFDTQFIEKNQ
ncbi:MAG: nucleoside deaminase [Haliscomenobacter sp.]|uniref:nucleoside deaminase n=1 Tax=Haliscomenobacter sp. TaxID=2717303 RepID=UPI0029A173CF|nr:nucleoside deaminase [Haliscomenobacter sp.]MDX2072628.1 nucleoside deaminase [Haliscomenobacter sp.]